MSNEAELLIVGGIIISGIAIVIVAKKVRDEYMALKEWLDSFL